MSSFIFKTKHLAIIVIALIAGISFTCYSALGIALFGLSCCLTAQEDHRLMLLVGACCFFFVGSTRYYQNRDLYFSKSELLEKNCNCVGIVQEIAPRLDEQESICIVMQVSSIQIRDQIHHVDKKIYIYLPFYTKLWLKNHQTIEVKNIILKHPRSTSYQEYLIRENVWAVAHPKWLSYSTIKKPTLFMQQIDEICSLPLSTTTHMMSQLTHSMYLSIFCGKKIKSTTTTEMKKLFAYWGISHHLARSGLHLIILIGLLLFLLSFIPCSSFKKQWVIIILLLFYYATTYSSVAFMRAFYMYLFYTACKQFHIPSNSIHILLITTLLVLMTNPHHLFFLDFQLSFSITLLILWFCKMKRNIKTIAS